MDKIKEILGNFILFTNAYQENVSLNQPRKWLASFFLIAKPFKQNLAASTMPQIKTCLDALNYFKEGLLCLSQV